MDINEAEGRGVIAMDGPRWLDIRDGLILGHLALN